MKIVITGALGHIGSKLFRDLPKSFSNFEIVLVDNLSTQRYCSLFNLPKTAKYKFVEIDIIKDKVTKIIQDSMVVIHLAALTNAEKSFENARDVEENNFLSTKIIAQECNNLNIPLIHLSSTSVYGTQKSIVDEKLRKFKKCVTVEK